MLALRAENSAMSLRGPVAQVIAANQIKPGEELALLLSINLPPMPRRVAENHLRSREDILARSMPHHFVISQARLHNR